MGAGCACHVPTPLGRGDRRHVAPALRGRSGQAWPSSAHAAAFVSASTDRGPPVLPWGQLDPGRGRRPGHPHGLPPQLVNRGRRHAAHRAASAGPHTSAPRRRVEDRPRRDAGAHRRDLVVTTYAMLTRQPGWRTYSSCRSRRGASGGTPRSRTQATDRVRFASASTATCSSTSS